MADARQHRERPSGPRRFLKIYASDPMLGNTPGNRTVVSIVNERLAPGPAGSRIRVVDYDGGQRRYYDPVDLDHPDILLNHGLDPVESDPRFHQQMVYAVAMKVIEHFERATGRQFHFLRRKPLLIVPHAFSGANAYYDRELHAVLFGYFRAGDDEQGPNLPGQTIFTCLSHDIVVHEITHAVMDRFKPLFLEPSNEDVQAFHEGFSDIVALFQHFTFRDFLEQAIQQTHTDLRERTLMVELARQFGYASGMGRALRSALDEPDKRLYASVRECHDRGAILVAAVFDAFFTVYQRRIQDLLRIATGGTGVLPQGYLHPDLVGRIAGEAVKTAESFLNMCIRAVDYLPPVDVTFGDYLRALVTADRELITVDRLDQRSALIEAFRQRGIYPMDVASLAEESMVWSQAPPRLPPVPVLSAGLAQFVTPSVALTGEDATNAPAPRDPGPAGIDSSQARALQQYARRHHAAFQLDARLPISVRGFHFLFRVGQDGRPDCELVAQFVQSDKSLQDDLGGIPFRGGTTVVAEADGRVKYVIAKPIGKTGAAGKAARQRLDNQRAFTRQCAASDPMFSWHPRLKQHARKHMAVRMKLSHVHRGFYR